MQDEENKESSKRRLLGRNTRCRLCTFRRDAGKCGRVELLDGIRQRRRLRRLRLWRASRGYLSGEDPLQELDYPIFVHKGRKLGNPQLRSAFNHFWLWGVRGLLRKSVGKH